MFFVTFIQMLHKLYYIKKLQIIKWIYLNMTFWIYNNQIKIECCSDSAFYLHKIKSASEPPQILFFHHHYQNFKWILCPSKLICHLFFDLHLKILYLDTMTVKIRLQKKKKIHIKVIYMKVAHTTCALYCTDNSHYFLCELSL